MLQTSHQILLHHQLLPLLRSLLHRHLKRKHSWRIPCLILQVRNANIRPIQTRIHQTLFANLNQLSNLTPPSQEEPGNPLMTALHKVRTIMYLMDILVLMLFLFTLIFNLVSINTQGLRNFNRRHSTFNLLKRQKHHIIFLQETHWTPDLEADILREWGGSILFNHFSFSVRGVAILFHPHLVFKNTNFSTDSQGRLISVISEIEDQKFNLVNIYAPCTYLERRDFFSTIPTYLSCTTDIILGGDFSCISDIKLDKQGGNPAVRQTTLGTLANVTQQHHLIDICRNRHPDKRQYTWTGKHPQNNTFIHTRIDKFFTSPTLSHKITHADIKPFPLSDHDLISLTLDLSSQPRGDGYWHFNNTLLTDEHFNTAIQNFWTTWLTKKSDFTSPLLWWDRAKQHFKSITIKRSTHLRRLERLARQMLENKLLRLQQRLANGTSTDTEAYLQAKTELQHYHLSKLDALTTRTQTRYTEEGEKSTRYFYSLERRQQTKHTISMLTRDNLDSITEPHDILLETHRFYKNLYTPEPIDVRHQDQFLDIHTPSFIPPF